MTRAVGVRTAVSLMWFVGVAAVVWGWVGDLSVAHDASYLGGPSQQALPLPVATPAARELAWGAGAVLAFAALVAAGLVRDLRRMPGPWVGLASSAAAAGWAGELLAARYYYVSNFVTAAVLTVVLSATVGGLSLFCLVAGPEGPLTPAAARRAQEARARSRHMPPHQRAPARNPY